MISFIILGISVLLALGVFAYQQYLQSARNAKADEVQKAQASIDTANVEDFIRTRNRFSAAGTLLDNHIVASNFFSVLESITLENVRFNSLDFKVGEDNETEIHMEGIARTFNALASQSSAFAAEKRIKRAIFSDIAVGEQNTVTFSLTAELDPRLISFTSKEIPMQDIPVETPTDISTSSPEASATPAVTSPSATTTTP